MALRTLPVRRAGNRANLFLGGDRELMMFAGLLAFTLVVAAQDRVATVAGGLLWFVTAFALRRMAKRDAKLRHVYLRHRRYRSYYPARTTPFRTNGAEQGSRYA